MVCARPYHALFMHNMLIRPTAEELKEFGEPDFVIYNSGPFPANRFTSYMTSSTSVDLSLSHKELVILGEHLWQIVGVCTPSMMDALSSFYRAHMGVHIMLHPAVLQVGCAHLVPGTHS